ncbi:MAG: LysM peptidoglycan-binding domain-containing protein [Polyangiales bacterium]
MRPHFALAFVLSLSAASSGSAQQDEQVWVAGEESAALEALRDAERSLFGRPTATPSDLSEAGTEVVFGAPESLTSEIRPSPRTDAAGAAVPWLENIELPDMPIQWRAPVIRYLEYFRQSRRGRSLMNAWLRRSTRYGAMIRDTLREAQLPEDLRCVAMAESGFDPTVRSHRGAVGMWQFVERTGREYDLNVTRWVDERMDPVESTSAAARFLGDLYRRLGRWELALAAYNMGYPALVRSIRKYNTNDYWTLASLEAGLPFETTIYVAKIMACSVVMRNPARFGFDTDGDEPLTVEDFQVGGGVNLGQLARAAGVSADLIRTLNPHLRRGRTPPRGNTSIHIPAGQSEVFARAWGRLRARDSVTRPYVVRFGETVSGIARRFGMSARALRELNGIESRERIAGVTLLVSARPPRDEESEEPPVVVTPPRSFQYEGRVRVFYRTLGHDTATEIARFFGVSPDDLRRWNGLDEDATLHSRMMLQLFVPEAFDLDTALVFREDAVRIVALGSEEFFDDHEARRGRVRFVHIVREGDTVRGLARRYGLSSGSVARINRFGRRSDLEVGQRVIIYADPSRAPSSATAEAIESSEPETPAGETPAAEAPAAETPAPNAPPETQTEPETEASGEAAPETEAAEQEQEAESDAEPETEPETEPAALEAPAETTETIDPTNDDPSPTSADTESESE